MVHQEDKGWFLAQLKPNCAKIAERNLNRQGFETFLPMEEETKRTRGKFISTLRPAFPGYIFVAFNIAMGHWRAVNSTYGINRLVSFSKDPVPVPRDIINQLMLRCDPSGKFFPAKLLKRGDKVRLTAGPFTDFLAKIETIAPDQRAWILMEIMGTQTRVATTVEQLETV